MPKPTKQGGRRREKELFENPKDKKLILESQGQLYDKLAVFFLLTEIPPTVPCSLAQSLEGSRERHALLTQGHACALSLSTVLLFQMNQLSTRMEPYQSRSAITCSNLCPHSMLINRIWRAHAWRPAGRLLHSHRQLVLPATEVGAETVTQRCLHAHKHPSALDLRFALLVRLIFM